MLAVVMTRALSVLLPLAVALAACSEKPQQAAAPPPPAVTVAKPTKRTIVDKDEYVGRFIPVDSVEIRARVSGYLDKVEFTDGQLVKKGDPLFTVDPRPFQATLAQVTANLTQARANLSFTEADLTRAQQLVRDRTVTEQTFDQRTQAKRVAEASVAANEAAVRQAQLDIQFTDLRAPVAGRIGDRRVSQGNLVTGGTGGNTTLLATIVSLDPIRFEFTFDEAAYLRYTRLSGSVHDVANHQNEKGKVALKLLDEKDFTHTGVIDFVDNVIDRTSGTIRGRAVFENAEGLFTPGMFARIQVPASAAYEALLVPDVAIGTEQVRKFVFVVDKDNVARAKYVTLGEAMDGLRVIKDGLAADDSVIINGIARVRPGGKVTPQAPGNKPAQPGPSAKAN